MTWLVFEVLMVVLERGVGVEERGGGGVRRGWGFYSETANPPIKRVLFNNARQFPEVGLTPPLFYKEMIFHTQTSLVGCSRGGERALEDMKMVSFSFLLRFGSPSSFYYRSLNLIFIWRSRFLQAMKSLEVIECCVWFERRKFVFFTHTHTPVLASWPRGWYQIVACHSAEVTEALMSQPNRIACSNSAVPECSRRDFYCSN